MGRIEDNFISIYGKDSKELANQKKRYSNLLKLYQDSFGEKNNLFIISTPGRTEISGNHTDHNGGKVIAASINLDIIAIFSKNDDTVSLKSDLYKESFTVNINSLEYRKDEAGTTNALIRGIADGFVKNGFKVGGFKCALTSDVRQGSGLSSSASIEVLIGSIFNFLYNNNSIPSHKIAKIGQYAENNFFGKPCGLMDQLACATGGIIAIDFKDGENPGIQKLDFDLGQFGYTMLVLDTGGTHHNLTNDYAAVPKEMNQIAAYFGEVNCSGIKIKQILNDWNNLRKQFSDRALLRVIHFINENKRVSLQIEALKNNNIDQFLFLVNKSGDSSFKYLQNLYSIFNVEEQPLSLALAITDEYIQETGNGACRVHGGGFAGTILVFLPEQNLPEYVAMIEKLFGTNSVSQLNIRPYGSFIYPITSEEFLSLS